MSEKQGSRNKDQVKIRVCRGKSCSCFGSKRVMEVLEEETGLQAGKSNKQVNLDYCLCLGRCAHAPNVEIDERRMIHQADPETIWEKIQNGEGGDVSEREIDVDEITKL